MASVAFLDMARLVPEAMLLLAGDGTILAANAAAEEGLSPSGEPLAGLRLPDLAEGAGEQITAILRLCLRSEEPHAGAMLLRGKDGRAVRMRTSGARADEGGRARIVLRLVPDPTAGGPRSRSRRHAPGEAGSAASPPGLRPDEPGRSVSPDVLLLQQQVEELTAEVHRRKAVEAALHVELSARASAERSAERVEKLQELTSAFSEALTPHDVAAAALREGMSTIGASRARIALLAEGGAALDVLVAPMAPEPSWQRIPLLADVVLAEAVRTKEPHFFPTPGATFARLRANPLVGATMEEARAAIPLVVGERTLGVLDLGFGGRRCFDADEQDFILEAARRCAQALERARLYEAAARARADAEAANRARDEFLSNVSHELRTPLTAILGWADMLRKKPPEPASSLRALGIIARNARTLALIVEDILDVSRMAVGKLRLTTAPVDAAAVVRAALDVVRQGAEAAGLQIEVEIDAEAGVVVADAGRLQQVFVNLLANAVKFTPRGGRLEVRLDRRPDGVRFRVTDTGKGISPTFLPHVFERFQQAEVGNAKSHGGLGLGLAIVKHLVEAHGGTITAASEGIGCGATFTVTLPPPPPGLQIEGDRLTPEPLRLDGVRVVVVDDNDDAREIVAVILREQGAEITPASSAAEALRAFEQSPQDVLVADIGMPGEDGYALLRRLRTVLPLPVHAVALTAYAGVEDARMAALCGFDQHLAKPVAPAKLVEVVARLAGRTIGG